MNKQLIRKISFGVRSICTWLCCLMQFSASAQKPGSAYHNMEKYWWYRYRLVNDFMKTGPLCGESIPAQRRIRMTGLDTAGRREAGVLKFDDATIDLGNYIAMLATEYRIAANCGLNTDRTLYELHYALNAFDRIDSNAEAYCEDIDGTYPCGPEHAAPFPASLNGFFIRDDVPQNFSGGANRTHFNRAGISRINPTNGHIDAGSIVRRARIPGEQPVPWPYKVKRMPWEESQDQVVQLSMGMALTAKLASGASFVMGTDLGFHGLSSMQRMIAYINNGPASSARKNWDIQNPVTRSCVYGISPEDPNCWNGGAKFFSLSPGAAQAVKNAGGTSSLVPDARKNDLVWQALQLVTFHSDLGFWGTFAALSDSWRSPFGTNQTWHRLQAMAQAYDWGNPHLPYLYRVLYPGKGAPYKAEELSNIFDAAPPCGIHNYNGTWSTEPNPDGTIAVNAPNTHYWSGNDWIAEHYHRNQTDVSSDCNGLDYMTLFNLYNLQDTGYLTSMFNSYYRQDHADTFPIYYPPYKQLIGTHELSLTLNFLEYLSSRDYVSANGNLTLRCGKSIDLLPGFNTEPGATVLTYTEDYAIDCGDISRAGKPAYAGEAYHYAIVNPKPSDPKQVTVLDSPPDGVPYKLPGNMLPEWDIDTMSCAEKHLYADSLIKEIFASGDPDMITYVQTEILPNMDLSFCDSNDANFNIYPNPGKETFTFVFAGTGHYELFLFNIAGVAVLHTRSDNVTSITVAIGNLPDGIYVAEVHNADGKKQSKKVVIVH